MAKTEKPFFHVILSDRDEWVVEAEWSDSTLERVSTFGDYSAAADWIANQSETSLAVRRVQDIAKETQTGRRGARRSATSVVNPYKHGGGRRLRGRQRKHLMRADAVPKSLLIEPQKKRELSFEQATRSRHDRWNVPGPG
jgi:hypothetical protein